MRGLRLFRNGVTAHFEYAGMKRQANINGNCTQDTVIQNLQDAGCGDTVIDCFLNDYKEGKVREGIQILQKYRWTLLEELHREQQKIDCLDYLIFVLQKQEN